MLVYWPHYVSSCPEQVKPWASVHLLRPISPAPDNGLTVKGFKCEESLRGSSFKLLSFGPYVSKHNCKHKPNNDLMQSVIQDVILMI